MRVPRNHSKTEYRVGHQHQSLRAGLGGVRFSKTKTDRFEQKAVDSDDLEDQTFCFANCATEFGWYDTEDTFSRTAALLAELLYAVKDAPVSRVFTHRERQSRLL